MEQRIGLVIALLVFGVVGTVLFFNLKPRDPQSVPPHVVSPGEAGTDVSDRVSAAGAPFREYPIGEAEQNGMQIVAVWLPPIEMEGLDLPQGDDVIHLEADVHALEGNVHGFGRGAWIPYLTIEYAIESVDGSSEPLHGRFMPMVAKDGPHYGATIPMPGAGKFKLTYKFKNPSANHFGRHSDPVTGVAEWWDDFSVSFDFHYPGSNPTGRAGSSDN